MRMAAVLASSCLALLLTGAVVAQVGKSDTLLDPNVASKEKLAALPHMTEEIVKTILDGRPFLGMPKLDAELAKHLDAEKRKELYGKMFIAVDLNTAKADEIQLIPGAGKKMAREFAEYRPWKSFAQFRREIGKYVDEKEVARLEQYVFIPLDLNTASEADFMTIPGVGKKMAHEFEEYRPWKSFEQFRREIGKYVDAKEVARLERYVVIVPIVPAK